MIRGAGGGQGSLDGARASVGALAMYGGGSGAAVCVAWLPAAPIIPFKCIVLDLQRESQLASNERPADSRAELHAIPFM